MRLTVKSLKQKDAGRGLAAVDRTAMAELGIESGNYIDIEGEEGTAVARIWPGYPEDDDRGIVRIDGQMRSEIGVGIDDPVTVQPADVDVADELTVSLPDTLRVRGDISPLLSKKLKGQAVTAGQSVPVSLGLGAGSAASDQRITVSITDATPDGTVVVTGSTDVSVDKAPLTQRVDRSDGDEPSPTDDGGEDVDSPEGTSPNVTYEDIGGLDDELEQVREMIELPMRHPELFQQLGIEPPKGVLLHGPPGTGKTLMAKAVANEIDATFSDISGPEIMSKYYGESEEQLREVFEEATENAPAVVFVDEIDSIAPKRGETSGDVERRIVAQLLSLMDGLEDRGEVVVIGATNRADALDPALRRGGRFDREIEVGIPDRDGREEVLQVHTRGMPLAEDVDLEAYAESTHGFVGADIEQFAKEAAMNALRRVRPELDLETDQIDAETLAQLEVTAADFDAAQAYVDPSALREVFVEVPDVTWTDVGGLEDTKARLRETIQWPMAHDDVFEHLAMDAATGVLMYGPPGTGKTLIAKAVANEADSNFISVKGPELLDKFVGESEKGVREVFDKARSNAPTVVFFDEIDAIASERKQGGGSSNVGERVVSQLLTELDGLEDLEDVTVIATSNRPDLIDDALLRPGRLDTHVHVPVPDMDAREEILAVHAREKPLADDVDLLDLADRTQGYVGADIEALCREASMQAAREYLDAESGGPGDLEAVVLESTHFEHAIETITPSVDDDTRRHYAELEAEFGQTAPTGEDGSFR